MKRILTVLLLLVFALPAFAEAPESFTGTWFAESMSVPAYTFEPLFPYDGEPGIFGMILNDDGSGTIVRGNITEECRYSDTSLTVGESSYPLVFVGDRIYVSGLEDPNDAGDMKYDFVFGRTLSYHLLPMPCDAENADALVGNYVGAYMQLGGKIADIENDGLTVTVAQDSVDFFGLYLPVRFEDGALRAKLSGDTGSSLLDDCTDILIRPCELNGVTVFELWSDKELYMRLYFREASMGNESGERAPDAASISGSSAKRVYSFDESAAATPSDSDVIIDVPLEGFERIGMDVSGFMTAVKTNGIPTEDIRLISLSPAGKTGIAFLNDIPLAYCDGQYRVVYPSAERGCDDVNGSMLRDFYGKGIRSIGSEGVCYSADGRYAAVLNNRQVTVQNRHIDPILIDLYSGEAIILSAYGSSMRDEDFGNTVSVSFTSDSAGLYCAVSRLGYYELRRIDIESLEDRLIVKTPEGLINTIFGASWCYPNLCRLRDGSFLFLSDTNDTRRPQSITRVSSSDGIDYRVQPHDLPASIRYTRTELLRYSAVSNKAFVVSEGSAMMTSSSQAPIILPGFLCRFDCDEGFSGIDELWAIDCENQCTVRFTGSEIETLFSEPQTMSTLNRCAVILDAEQSPDGNCVLILAAYYPEGSLQGRKALLMLDLRDMSIQAVSGIDAETILSPGVASEYEPCMSWDGDTLFVETKDGILRYEAKQSGADAAEDIIAEDAVKALAEEAEKALAEGTEKALAEELERALAEEAVQETEETETAYDETPDADDALPDWLSPTPTPSQDHCPDCGHALPEDNGFNYCPYCRALLFVSVTRCPACDCALPEGNNFNYCPYCRAVLREG